MKIKIKDLRTLLFEIDDQGLTISELRSLLFEEDREFELNNNTKRKLGKF